VYSLALRVRATQDTTPTITQAAISACTTEKVRSDVHAKPTEESDWPLPVASNLLTFHGGIACAYNQISGELMRSLDLLRPTSADEGLSILKYICDMICAGLIDRLVVVFLRSMDKEGSEE
jgi:hypothetical protein